jgi:hypothetical protein
MRKFPHTLYNYEECQELLVDEICDPKYSRNGEKEHKRAGESKRTLGTRFGTVGLELIKVRSQGRIFKPINELIELDGKKLKGHILHRDRSSYQAYLQGL